MQRSFLLCLALSVLGQYSYTDQSESYKDKVVAVVSELQKAASNYQGDFYDRCHLNNKYRVLQELADENPDYVRFVLGLKKIDFKDDRYFLGHMMFVLKNKIKTDYHKALDAALYYMSSTACMSWREVFEFVDHISPSFDILKEQVSPRMLGWQKRGANYFYDNVRYLEQRISDLNDIILNYDKETVANLIHFREVLKHIKSKYERVSDVQFESDL